MFRSKALWFAAACVLRRLIHEDGSGWFLRPVSKKVAPDYCTRIERPMDLGTVFCKLLLKQYDDDTTHYSAFVQDVHLIWSNAIEYNGIDTAVGVEASRLNQVFEAGWKELISGTKHRVAGDTEEVPEGEGGIGGDDKGELHKAGDKVNAQYKGKGKYYPGSVVSSTTALDNIITYVVHFDDGYKDDNVSKKSIRRRQMQKSGSVLYADGMWLEHFEMLINYVNRPTGVNEGDLIYDMATLPVYFTTGLERLLSQQSRACPPRNGLTSAHT